MKKSKLLDFGVLYLAFLVYSFSSVFAKIASQQPTIFMMLVYMAVEFVLLAVYALIWQQALKRFPLIVAMSSKGVTVILSLLWSVLIFHEAITLFNLLGTAMVVIGIGLVSADD